MRLYLSLLGPFQVTLEDQPAVFATDRARALLAYLAVEANRPHRREALAALIWPDYPEAAARRSLSQALVRVRRAIDDYHASPPFLLITGKTIQFNAATAKLDVARFENLLATCAAHPHPALVECPVCIKRMEEAANLYRGSFLQGLFLTDSQPFEEWALFKQEQLHRQALEALGTLAAHYQARGAYEQAERYAERQLALEPWREEAHRQLMQALAMSKQRAAAMAQYEKCCRLLADELGTQPDPETIALYERIRRGELARAEEPNPQAAPAQARQSPPLVAKRTLPRHNLPPQATPFVGRQTELAELTRWLADPEVRLVTILGPGGMGKTRLAIQAALAQLDVFAHGVRYAHLAPVDPTIFAG
ncbi:MAG: winged helix-turn-helix domain-containing protein, partial [Anaerolineales bacterium]